MIMQTAMRRARMWFWIIDILYCTVRCAVHR